MATEIQSMVGSGTQQYRQDNPGKKHAPALGVHVLNWEDITAVKDIAVKGFEVDTNGVMLPSGTYNLEGRRAIAIYNNGSEVIYLGPSGVTADQGYPVATGTEKALSIAANLDLWAITAANSSNVRIMEIA